MSECKASGAFSDEKWHLMHCESSFIPSAVCFVNCACENVSGASPSSILLRSFALSHSYLLSHDAHIYAVTIQSSRSRDFIESPCEDVENNALIG